MIDLEGKCCKIVMVGSKSVGKTQILTRYRGRQFDSNLRSTVGAEFSSKSVEVEPNLFLKVFD